METAQSLEVSQPMRAISTYVLALSYLVLTTAIIYVTFSHCAYDDPFITYRYAQNLSTGNGFVYNPGERMLSTSSPLMTFILAGVSLWWNDLPGAANFLGAFSLALGGLFLWDLARTWKSPLVGWVCLVLYPTFPLLISTLGSETPLSLAFCLGLFAFYARRNYNIAAVLAALAVLTRPDSILALAIIVLDFLFRVRRPIPWRAILIFVGICAPWFLFAWIYFGSPIPVTLSVKQHQGEMTISQRFAPGVLSMLRLYIKQPFFAVEVGLALAGVMWMFWKQRVWGVLFSWSMLYFLAYTLLGVSLYFWYVAPLVPGFLAAVGLGLSAVAAQARNISDFFSAAGQNHLKVKQPNWIIHLLTATILALAVGQGLYLWQMHLQVNPRMAAYRAVGEWLRENTTASTRIGMVEVGVIGYYSQRAVVDFAGLIQPEVADQFHRETTYANSAEWAMMHYQPEFLVLPEGVFPYFEKHYVAKNCLSVQRFSGDADQQQQILNVFDCRKRFRLPYQNKISD